MNYDPKDFWERRLRENSHTGWADPVIYAYDQEERLAIIDRYLDKIGAYNKTALDFGCGTGDFTSLLLEKGYRVLATDPYVRPKFFSKNCIFTPQIHRLQIPDQHLSLILSITVLDHITDNEALSQLLKYFRNKILPEGNFIMMEYALDKKDDRIRANSYQSFRCLAEWRDILNATGFRIENISYAPHPIECPSMGYTLYRKNVVVKTLSLLSRKKIARRLVHSVLRRYGKYITRRYPFKDDSTHESPLKIFSCVPIER